MIPVFHCARVSSKNNFLLINIFKNFNCHKDCSNMSAQNSINLKDFVRKLEEFASKKLAESWDNVGLLVEPHSKIKVSKVLLTNDLTEPVLDDALKKNVNFILSYHPPIFSPLKKITQDTWKGRIISACLENKIAVYSPHTTWDAAENGVTDWLAKAFISEGAGGSVGPLAPASYGHSLCHIIGPTEVLNSHLTGNNDHTLLSSKSIDYNNAYCSVLELLTTEQLFNKLSSLPNVISFKSNNVSKNAGDAKVGAGRLVELPGLTVAECVSKVKKLTGLSHVRLALAVNATQESIVKRIGVVAGSGGSLLRGCSADLYLTGEMSHHELLDACHNGASVILTNHSDSERGFLHHFRLQLLRMFPGVQVEVSTVDRDPLETV